MEKNSAVSELSKVKRRVNWGSGSDGYFTSISMSFRKGSALKNLEVFQTSERKSILVWVTQKIFQAAMLVHKLLPKKQVIKQGWTPPC